MLTLFGCTTSNDWEVVHPSIERMPSEIDFVIDVSEPSYGLLPNLPHPDSIQFIDWIGDSTKIEDEFYRVSNVHIGYDGLIYVKHFNTNSIRVYNSMGEFKYSIGRGGRGPGEFTQLGTFKLDENSQTLYAIDEHSFKIEVFSKVHDRFVYLRSIFHNFNSAHDLCLLGNELIVSGSSLPSSLQNGRLQNSSPIARINPLSGEIIATFGFVYPSVSGLYDMSLSVTRLGCNNETQTILGYSDHFPYIIGYSKYGDVKWRSFMKGYVSWEFIEFKKTTYKKPGLLHFTNMDIHNVKYPVQDLVIGKFSLLQFGWTGPTPVRNPSPPVRSEDKEPRYRSVLVNAETGELAHSDAYPLIGNIRENRVITYEILDPYQIRLSINKYN